MNKAIKFLILSSLFLILAVPTLSLAQQDPSLEICTLEGGVTTQFPTSYEECMNQNGSWGNPNSEGTDTSSSSNILTPVNSGTYSTSSPSTSSTSASSPSTSSSSGLVPCDNSSSSSFDSMDMMLLSYYFTNKYSNK